MTDDRNIASEFNSETESETNSISVVKTTKDLTESGKTSLTLNDAKHHIKTLERKIEKLKRKLKSYKAQIKAPKQSIDVGVQTEIRNDPIEKNICDEIKEAAELATQNSGFIYEETSGLYYDTKTGFYYNAEYGLYYDAKNGIYLQYRPESRTYVFHSKIHQPLRDFQSKRRPKKKTTANYEESKSSPSSNEFEDGQCSDSSTDEEDDSNNDAPKEKYPPCIRLMVDQSTNAKIKIGSLHIVTCAGGTLGREGTGHAVILPDINISKVHLKFDFDANSNSFLLTDMGSRNGTILDGKRLSASLQQSETQKILHGSRIQIGAVTLLCHIHEGNQTCGHCEPGLVQNDQNDVNQVKIEIDKSELHKRELKQLRKKFGINPYENIPQTLSAGYTDRAEKRRKTIGSQNPHEKTEVASIDESISSTNKGFKLLEKMGWKDGDSLGKDNTGITEPVPLIMNPEKLGLGHQESNSTKYIDIINNSSLPVERDKKIVWKKTQTRYKNLPNQTNAVFLDSD